MTKNNSPTQLLVRRPGSNKFLKASGRWTKRADAASNFPNVFQAVHTCLLRRLHEVEFVLRFKGETGEQCVRVCCR